jgi:hypothetical protein
MADAALATSSLAPTAVPFLRLHEIERAEQSLMSAATIRRRGRRDSARIPARSARGTGDDDDLASIFILISLNAREPPT